jgi:RecA-family ATPase
MSAPKDKTLTELNQQFGNNDTQSEEKVTRLRAIKLKEFLALELPARELILSPWLPTAGLCMIHAKPGVGKTHLSLNIAYAVASGGSFLGWEAEKPRGVLFVDGEMYPASLQERLALINQMNGDRELPAELFIISANLEEYGIPDLATVEGREAINQQITDEIDLIILDNLSSLITSGKENEAESWQPIQKWLLSLRGKGKSVLIVHHSAKTGDQRGTSKRIDVLDSSIRLERPEGYTQDEGARFNIHFEKSRSFHGEDAKPFEAHLSKDAKGDPVWITSVLKETTFDKVVRLFNDGFSQEQIAKTIDRDASVVSRHVKNAHAKGLLKAKEGKK